MRGVVGKLGSEHERSRLPQGWNIVSEDLLLPASIVGSFTKVPCERTPVCSLTVLASSVTEMLCVCQKSFLLPHENVARLPFKPPLTLGLIM